MQIKSFELFITCEDILHTTKGFDKEFLYDIT